MLAKHFDKPRKAQDGKEKVDPKISWSGHISVLVVIVWAMRSGYCHTLAVGVEFAANWRGAMKMRYRYGLAGA